MAHLASILPVLKTTSALTSGAAQESAPGFAAVLASLTPKTQVPQEHVHVHAAPATIKVVAGAAPREISKPDIKPLRDLVKPRTDAKQNPAMRDAKSDPKPAQPVAKPVAAPSPDDDEAAQTTQVTPVRPVVAANSPVKVADKAAPDVTKTSPPDAENKVPAVVEQTPAHDAPPAGTKLAQNVVDEIVAAAKGSVEQAIPAQLVDAAVQAAAPKAAGQTASPAKQGISERAPAKPEAKAHTPTQTAPSQAASVRAPATIVVIERSPRAVTPAAPQPADKVATVGNARPMIADVIVKSDARAPAPSDAPLTVPSDDTSSDRAASQPQSPAPQAASNGPALQPEQAAQPAVQPAQPNAANPAALAVQVAPNAPGAAPAAATSVQAAAPQAASEPLPAQPNVAALAAAIAAKSAPGSKMFEIRLDPPEMGRVEVHLNVSRDGKAEATLYADRPETVALLQRDSQNLERVLKDAGLDVSNSSLNFSLKDEQRQGDGGGASSAHTRNLSDAVVARSEAVNASLASLSLAPDSARLDIRV